jgi:hypothetical protein
MKSGWTNDRNINIGHYKKLLKDELSIFNEHFAEFLSQSRLLKAHVEVMTGIWMKSLVKASLLLAQGLHGDIDPPAQLYASVALHHTMDSLNIN